MTIDAFAAPAPERQDELPPLHARAHRSIPITRRWPDGPGRHGLQAQNCYGGGRYDRWIKVEHRAHPAFSRVLDQF